MCRPEVSSQRFHVGLGFQCLSKTFYLTSHMLRSREALCSQLTHTPNLPMCSASIAAGSLSSMSSSELVHLNHCRLLGYGALLVIWSLSVFDIPKAKELKVSTFPSANTRVYEVCKRPQAISFYGKLFRKSAFHPGVGSRQRITQLRQPCCVYFKDGRNRVSMLISILRDAHVQKHNSDTELNVSQEAVK